MRTVRVNKAELIVIVETNRIKHRQAFEEALAAWKARVIYELDKAVDDAKAGVDYRYWFNLPRPEDHTGDYDDVIGMLEMHVDDTIELEIKEYRQYVTDDWGWKAGFTQSYETYVVGD